MIQVGRFEITSVVTGRFRLDGGAMFGVVPRVLWERKTKPDDQNRINLAMRTLVAVDPAAGQVILVDTGAGHKWPADEGARFALDIDRDAIRNALTPYGLDESDVTDIVVTHLHFDHNGGLTEWTDQPEGPTQRRFPKARHWLHEAHWRHACKPTARDRASFLDRDLQALAASDALHLVSGDEPASTIDGVRWVLSHGHTPYQLLPVFVGDQFELFWTGDMIPTTSHLPPAWIMAYDLHPLETLAEKQRLLAACRNSDVRLAFPHDPEIAAARVEDQNGKPIITEKVDL